jgi:uncharacterized protein (UPF0335 family)
MKPGEIKVKVIFTEGYQQRFTAACIRQIRRREAAEKQEREAYLQKEAM